MYIVSCRRSGCLVLGNPSIQNRNVQSRLGPLEFFHECLDRFEAFHVHLHHLNLRRLELGPNLLGSGLALLYAPYPKYHPRPVFHVRSSGFETYTGVSTGDEDRFPERSTSAGICGMVVVICLIEKGIGPSEWNVRVFLLRKVKEARSAMYVV